MYADSFPPLSSVSAWPARDLVDKARSDCGRFEIFIFVSIRGLSRRRLGGGGSIRGWIVSDLVAAPDLSFYWLE
jgi:hypothetical protein